MTRRTSGARADELETPDWVQGALEPRRRPASRAQSSSVPQTEARRAQKATPKHAYRADARIRPQADPFPGQLYGRLLLFSTVALLLFGLVMAYSASTAQAFFSHGSSWYFLKKQLIFAVAGVVIMAVLSRVDYTVWRKLALPFTAVCLFLLAVVALPGVGATINGARRWISVGGMTLQPSEFAKLAAVLLCASLIAARPRSMEHAGGFARVLVVSLLPLTAFIMLGKDLSTTIVITVAVAGVLVVAGARWKHMAGFGAACAAAFGLLILIEPYRQARLFSFIDPWAHADTGGYQTTQALIAVASGRVFGVGLGNSVQKFFYLPEQQTDMIAGVIGEELGLMGLLVLITLYGMFAWSGLRLAMACREPFARYLVAGFTICVTGQAVLNLGAAMGMLPVLGVPLPLVSVGGTSLLVALAGMGIMLNVANNRRSFIGVSPERRIRAGGGRGDRRAHGARAGGR